MKRFDRHEIFTADEVTFHSKTIRMAQDYYLSNDQSTFNPITNMLNGIWDGYLYDTLITDAIADGIPKTIVYRIEKIVDFINKKETVYVKG